MPAEAAGFDVVVVGSGAAGMTAALTAAHHGLSVVVIEKTGKFGGSTARPGGGDCVPRNEAMRQAGRENVARFSWDTAARQYSELFASLAG